MTNIVCHNKACKGGDRDVLQPDLKRKSKACEENERLRRRLEEKEEEEIRELERRRKMRNFWAYDGTPQEGFSE